MLGARVHALTMAEWQQLVGEAVASGSRFIVVSLNLHGVYLYHREHEMRELHAQVHVRIDGMPLVYWARLLGHPARREHRVTWVDWMPALMGTAARRSWRVFYLGGKPGVADRGAAILARQHPGLSIETQHGFFDSTPGGVENAAVVERINRYRPDVLLVGMGMPRQERWVRANHRTLAAPVVLTCGAALDYFSGEATPPPRWMGQVGLEWLHRLSDDPRRLARRYLVEPWSLLGVMARDVWRHRLLRR